MPSIACSEPVLVHLRNTARAQTLAHISRKLILSLSTMEDSSCLIAGRSEVQVDQPFTEFRNFKRERRHRSIGCRIFERGMPSNCVVFQAGESFGRKSVA